MIDYEEENGTLTAEPWPDKHRHPLERFIREEDEDQVFHQHSRKSPALDGPEMCRTSTLHGLVVLQSLQHFAALSHPESGFRQPGLLLSHPHESKNPILAVSSTKPKAGNNQTP